jgi:hypothetical protein
MHACSLLLPMLAFFARGSSKVLSAHVGWMFVRSFNNDSCADRCIRSIISCYIQTCLYSVLLFRHHSSIVCDGPVHKHKVHKPFVLKHWVHMRMVHENWFDGHRVHKPIVHKPHSQYAWWSRSIRVETIVVARSNMYSAHVQCLYIQYLQYCMALLGSLVLAVSPSNCLWWLPASNLQCLQTLSHR